MLNPPNWDKNLTKKLVDMGLSWEHARLAVGVIAEEKQIADRVGYERGFNSGYDFAITKKKER